MDWVMIKDRHPNYMEPVLIVGRMRYAWEKQYTYFIDFALWLPGDMWELNNDWYEVQRYYELLCWAYFPKIPYDLFKED